MKGILEHKLIKYLLQPLNLSYEANSRKITNTKGSDVVLPYASVSSAGLLQRNQRMSFSPTLNDAGGTGNYSFTNSGSYYERMGNMVYFHVILTNITQTGTPSNTLYIGGLPFSVTSTLSYPFSIGGFTRSNVNFYNLIARSRGGNAPGFNPSDIVFEYSDSLSDSIGQGSNNFMKSVSFTNGIINVCGWYPITFGSSDYVN